MKKKEIVFPSFFSGTTDENFYVRVAENVFVEIQSPNTEENHNWFYDTFLSIVLRLLSTSNYFTRKSLLHYDIWL